MNKIWLALASVLAASTTLQLYLHHEKYTAKINEVELEQAYQQSQYVNPASQHWIDDPPLYSYAGIRYIEGNDPSQINFELQPLTKYAFGVFIKLFGNPNNLQLILYWLLILQTFFLAKNFNATPKQSVLASALVALDPLIRLHAHTPYLDLMLANLILLFIRIVPKSSPIKNGVLIGLIALAKSFMIGALIFFVFLVFLHLQKKLNLKKTFTSATVAVLTYLLGYIAFFLHGKSLFDFINLHLDIMRLYRGYVPEYPLGEIIRIIMFGQWRKWFDDFGFMSVDEWWLLWPLSFVATIIFFIRHRFTTKNPTILLGMLFILIYFISITLKLTFPRYLMPLLPFMYVFLSMHLFDQYPHKKVQ